MKISSPPTRVKLPAAKLFELAGNCQNMARYMPEQVKDFNATEDTCSFTIENMAKVTLKILEKSPFTYIRYTAENDRNIPLFLELKMNAVAENETDVEVEIDMDIPMFLKPMLQKPLRHFVEALSEKIKTDAEKNEL